MIEDIHSKARRLILESRIEDLQQSDQRWLDEHLKDCLICRECRDATDATIIRFKSTSFSMNPELLQSTQRLVQARAKELSVGTGLNPVWAWITAIATLAWIAVTMPYLWRGFEWIGARTGLPDLVWQMSFGFWWLLPAMILVGLLAIQNNRDIFSKDY